MTSESMIMIFIVIVLLISDLIKMADTGGHSHQGHHHTTQAPDHHTPDPGLSNGIHQGHHHGVHDALGGHGGHSSHTTHDGKLIL